MKPELTTPDPAPVPALPTWRRLVPKAAAQSAGLTLAAVGLIAFQVVQEGGALLPFVRAVGSPSGLLLAGARRDAWSVDGGERGGVAAT